MGCHLSAYENNIVCKPSKHHADDFRRLPVPADSSGRTANQALTLDVLDETEKMVDIKYVALPKYMSMASLSSGHIISED